MTTVEPPSSVTRVPVADELLASIATRDFDRLAATFEPDAVFDALLPDGFHQWSGPERVTAAFARWFGRVDECELLAAAVGLHGPRLQLRWRVRVRGGHVGDVPFVVEQHVYADPGPTGRIQYLAMLCSGFIQEHPDA